MSNRNHRNRPKLPKEYKWCGLTYGRLEVIDKRKNMAVLCIVHPHAIYKYRRGDGAWVRVGNCTTREQALNMAAALVALGEADE